MDQARPRRAVSDEGLRDVIVRVIAETGVDEATVPRIASAGGLSTASVYRRYDTGVDAISEVWTQALGDHFRRLMRAPLTWSADPASTEAAWLRRELATPSPQTIAVVNIVAAARRLAYIGEDLRAEVEDDLVSITSHDARMPPVMSTAHLLPVVGGLFLSPLADEFPHVISRQFETFAACYADQEHWLAESGDYRYVAPPPVSITTGDATLDDLSNAALRVIVRYGYAGATATRVAREARRSMTSAYRRVGNKDEFLLSAVTAALAANLGLSGTESASAMSFSRADRLQRALHVSLNQIDDRNRINRALVLELLLAARVDRNVNALLKPWFAEVINRFHVFAREVCPDRADELTDRWIFRIAGGIGAMVLSLSVPRFVTRFDPTPILSANDAASVAALAPARPHPVGVG